MPTSPASNTMESASSTPLPNICAERIKGLWWQRSRKAEASNGKSRQSDLGARAPVQTGNQKQEVILYTERQKAFSASALERVCRSARSTSIQLFRSIAVLFYPNSSSTPFPTPIYHSPSIP